MSLHHAVVVLLLAASPAAFAQAGKMSEAEKVIDAERRKTGAQHCEVMKGNVETLKGIHKKDGATWSDRRRASWEKSIAANEAEMKKCCADTAQCKRDMDTLLAPKKK